MKLVLTTVALAGVSACGFTDAGGGTGTLEVQLDATYDFGDQMHLRLQVNDASGNGVDGASVVLKDGDSGEAFTLDNQGGQGDYRADVPAYHRLLALKVEKGSDNLDAQLEGPGPHVINAPAHNSTVSRSSDLTVEWATKDGVLADEIDIRLRGGGGGNADFDTTIRASDETGSYDIPSQSLVEGDRSVRVTRRNKLVPTGGRGQSSFSIEYSVRNEFVITP